MRQISKGHTPGREISEGDRPLRIDLSILKLICVRYKCRICASPRSREVRFDTLDSRTSSIWDRNSYWILITGISLFPDK